MPNKRLVHSPVSLRAPCYYRYIGISQRDCCSFYEYLEADVPDLQKFIVAFFDEHIREIVPLHSCELSYFLIGTVCPYNCLCFKMQCCRCI